ncbi:MAG: tRNA (guanosine(46)-N7)-methyltransferase TrmB [Pseudomonadota bacterium]
MSGGRRRAVQSFVRRAGRLTRAQQRAMAELWPRYGIAAGTAALDLDAVFGRGSGRRVVEIGYGNGESLVAMAAADPAADFLGIEVHEPGVGHCLLEIERSGVANVRLIAADAMELLAGPLSAATIDRINLYFPDPWPKKRHHKRRIFNPAFLAAAHRVLKPGGRLHIATDWAPYAEHIREQLRDARGFKVIDYREHAGEAPPERPTTKFERRGLALGHRIFDWIAVAGEDSGETADARMGRTGPGLSDV